MCDGDHLNDEQYCSTMCAAFMGNASTEECNMLVCDALSEQCVVPRGALNCSDRGEGFCEHACHDAGEGEEVCRHMTCDAGSGNCTSVPLSCSSQPSDFCVNSCYESGGGAGLFD